MLLRLLCMADSESLNQRLLAIVATMDVEPTESPVRGNFWDRIAENPADLIVVSRALLPEPADDTVESIRTLSGEPDVIVLWERENPIERARLLTAGCYAILQEGLPDDVLRDVLESLAERRRDRSEDRLQLEISEPEYSLADFDSSSPLMKNFMRMVRRVVKPDSSLLLLGETGVGKERLARSIHLASPRGREPFIPVNCAAFPETLLDGELFGYHQGAFTGATSDRRGYFESAHGGTIFLDEIGELPNHLQVKLLRVLQERTIQPLGSEKVVAIDVRVMAATNRDLEEEIIQRRFRRDLYYRLGVVTLDIPPLRDHPEDIPELLQRYLENFRTRMGRNIDSIAPDAMASLCQYDWPGNIRELINVIERAVILCESDTLSLRELPSGMGPSGMGPSRMDSSGMDSSGMDSSGALRSLIKPESTELSDTTLLEENWHDLSQRTLQALERRYLSALLKESRGHINDAVVRSGIKPRTLYQMMQRQGFDKRDYKRTPR